MSLFCEIKGSKIQPYEMPGTVIGDVHDRAACAGRPCVVHNPTDHHMSDWPLHWRNDRKIFERICDCGIGHPDPDQWEYWEATDQEWQGVHGCCGCCSEPVSP